MPTFDLWALSGKHLMKSVCWGHGSGDLGKELFKMSMWQAVHITL